MSKSINLLLVGRILMAGWGLMILAFAGTVKGQVEIRDSISVSTMMDTTNGSGGQSAQKSTLMGGFKINSISPEKKVNALINLPEGGGIIVTVIGGAAGASIDLVVRSPFQKTLVRNANAHHGFSWDTTGFPAGTTFNIGINWYYWSQSGTEYGCQVQQVNDSTYTLGFEDMGIPPWYVDLIVQVVVHNGAELVVVYPTDELKDKKDIAVDPKMPDITAKAELKNFNGGTVNFQWNLRVQWKGDDGREFDNSFRGNTTATNSDVSPWTIDWKNMTRGGDEITLDVTATAGGKVYDKTINHPFIIVGDNPDKAAVKQGLSIEQQVFFYKESRFRQFRNDRDFPLWGSPHGYGLAQLDNIGPTGRHATDEEVWNWKVNRETGITVYNDKKNLASGYSTRINNGSTWYWINRKQNLRGYNDPIHKHWEWYPHAYTQVTSLTEGEELLKETFQRFNGGVYWRWIPDVPKDINSLGHWENVFNASTGELAQRLSLPPGGKILKFDNYPQMFYYYNDSTHQSTPVNVTTIMPVVNLLDTLVSLKHQAVANGWIDNQGVANSLDSKLDNAKSKLEAGDTTAAKNMLNAFVNEVEAQNGKHLTSEAYALLKYNAEYLIDRLPEK